MHLDNFCSCINGSIKTSDILYHTNFLTASSHKDKNLEVSFAFFLLPFVVIYFFFLQGLIPSLTLQQHRVSLQRQKREQNIKEQREQERNSPAKKKSSAASSLLCAKKSNKRKRLNSPFKRG